MEGKEPKSTADPSPAPETTVTQAADPSPAPETTVTQAADPPPAPETKPETKAAVSTTKSTKIKIVIGVAVVVALVGTGIAVKLYLDNKAKAKEEAKKDVTPVQVNTPTLTLPSNSLVALTNGIFDKKAKFAFTLKETNSKIPLVINKALVFDGSGGYAEFPPMTLDLTMGITFVAKVQLNKTTPFQRIFEFGNAAPNFSQNIIFCINDSNQIRWSVYETLTSEHTCDLNAAATIYSEYKIYVGRLNYTTGTNVTLTLESRSLSNPTKVEYKQTSTRTSIANYSTPRTLNNNYLGRGNWPLDPLSNMTLSHLYFYNSTLTLAQVESIINMIISNA